MRTALDAAGLSADRGIDVSDPPFMAPAEYEARPTGASFSNGKRIAPSFPILDQDTSGDIDDNA